MTAKTFRVCDNRECGAIIGDEGCECSRLTLITTSGKAFTAELCKTCSIQAFQGHVWTELREETIIPAEPVQIPEEPVPNPPSEEEGEEFAEEPPSPVLEEDEDEDSFDSLDDDLLGYIGEKGRASLVEITEHFCIDAHTAVSILARLRERGEIKRARGRGVWEVISHD